MEALAVRAAVTGLPAASLGKREQSAQFSSAPRTAFLGNSGPLAQRAIFQANQSATPVAHPLQIVCKESRIGKAPVSIPKGVSIVLDGQKLAVKGPLGELEREYPGEVKLTQEGDVIKVARASDTRRAREMHGLFRTLTNNMVVGVSTGFEKRLQMVGVGYRGAVDKTDLVLNLGFSHPVRMPIPAGITVKVEENTKVLITGRDKVAVGDFAANVRSWRPPEPYKGKGIKYNDEVIRRKEGKVGKKK